MTNSQSPNKSIMLWIQTICENFLKLFFSWSIHSSVLQRTNIKLMEFLWSARQTFHGWLTVFTVNEVLHQRLGNILKQLNLSCFNTKYFFKGVLRLKDKQKSIAQVYDIQQRIDKCHYYYVLHLLVSEKVSGLCWVQLRQEMCIVQILMVLLHLLILLIDLVL